MACRGTYKEDVVVPIPLTLIGESATINATGLAGAPTGAINGQAPFNGITIESSRVTVEGFKVEGAEGEGILAVNPDPVPETVAGMPLFTGTPITDVKILHNDVTGNDLGNDNPASPYVFCTPNGGGDCGEGIHLLSVANSTVLGNKSIGNSGGILLTDEFGPTHDNLIARNLVLNNVNDCGITIPSHNLGLNPTTGKPDPSFGGVYRNHVIGMSSPATGRRVSEPELECSRRRPSALLTTMSYPATSSRATVWRVFPFTATRPTRSSTETCSPGMSSAPTTSLLRTAPMCRPRTPRPPGS